jgi:Putative auto-transporter adhesin, head GIN domain
MFKKQSIVAAFILLIITSACAQTSKKMVFDGAAEDRKLSGFTSINVTNAFDVYISQGTEDAVAVSKSDASGTSNIITNVSGGVLYISYRYKGWSWSSLRNNKLKAYITVKDLQKLTVSGACNVSFVDAITSNYLQISMSGASDIKGAIKVNGLKVGASGASNISLSGTATDADFNVSGACSIKSLELVTDNCTVVASGASNVKLTINKYLKANISGASDIRYKGTVSRFETRTSGASDIKPY